MTKLKKLMMLCTAMVATASIALFAGCTTPSTDTSSSNEPTTSSEAPATSSEAPATSSETPVDSSETPVEPEDDGVYYEYVKTVVAKVPVREQTPVTVNFAEAGLYYVCSADANFAIGDWGDPSLTIEVAEAGDVELYVSANHYDTDAAWNYIMPDGTMYNLIFKIYKVEEVKVDATLKAEGMMLAGAYTPVTVTIPTAGVYTFKSATEVMISTSNLSDDLVSYGGFEYTFVTDEDNAEVTFFVTATSNFVDYAFEISYEMTTGLSTYTEKATTLSDTMFLFEAEEAGAYQMTFNGDELTPGYFDCDTLQVEYYYDYDPFEFDYDGTTPVLLFASFGWDEDGNELTSTNVTITRIGDVGYRSPEPLEPIYASPEQDNVMTLPVGAENYVYIIRLTGAFTLEWDNELVTVMAGVRTISSGFAFDGPGVMGEPIMFTVVNFTEEEQTVNFQVVAMPAPDMQLGYNDFNITDGYTLANFTAQEAGTYTFTVETENADVCTLFMNMPDMPITEVELEAGETINLAIALGWYAESTEVTVFIDKK